MIQVAKNYAKALFTVAKQADSIDIVLSELKIFESVFNAKFRFELKNPAIARNDTIKIIEEICKKMDLGKITTNFIATIAFNRRLGIFSEVCNQFLKLVKHSKNIIEVELISAVRLEKSEIDEIAAMLTKKYRNKVVEIKETIKESIIGGLQIKVDSILYDASLKSQLNSLTNQLIKASL